MSKHTRGREWKLKNDHDFQYKDGVSAALLVAQGPEIDEHKTVCVVEKTPLLAAAPELLEVLKLCEERLRHLDDAQSMGLWAYAKEAIAKAEGA